MGDKKIDLSQNETDSQIHYVHSEIHHVSRWDGKHTDGPACDFERKGGMLVVKPGRKIVRSELGDEVYFGKHRGSTWGELPIGYLIWLANSRKEPKNREKARRVLNELENLKNRPG